MHYCGFVLSPIVLTSFCFCALYVLSFVNMVSAALAAPIGYEDADGFHYGIKA